MNTQTSNVIAHIRKAICAHSDVTVDEAGKGHVEYRGRSISFNVSFFEDKNTFSIDFHFGIHFDDQFSQAEIFMGMYNDTSTVTHLMGSVNPTLRLSHCVAADLPNPEFILKLFESALEAWVVLRPGLERIQSEGLILDFTCAPSGFEPIEFYEEIVGDKLEGRGLIL